MTDFSGIAMPFLIFIITLLLFTIGLSGEEITGFDSRFYLFAKEMWVNGVSWFPTTYGEPYPDYPATSTVLIYLTARVGGGLNKLTAVLPSAVAASLMVVVTYLIGNLSSRVIPAQAPFETRAAHAPQGNWVIQKTACPEEARSAVSKGAYAGMTAAGFMLLTFMFIKSARALSLDMYPALMTAACFYLIYSADVLQKPARVKWIFPLFFLGFAFRGPIGLVIPTGVVCVYYLLDGRIKKMLTIGLASFVLLLACFGLLLLLAHHVGGQTFVDDVLRMQMVGRMNNHYQPVYYYFLNSFTNYALSFPLAVLVIVSMLIRRNHLTLAKADIQLIIKLIGWTLVVLIGMSIPGDKKPRYILAITPAIALLASYALIKCSPDEMQRILSGVKKTILIIIAALSFILLYIFIVEPLEIYYERTRDFVTTVEEMRNKAHAQLIFYQEGKDNLPIKYMVNSTPLIKPIFIDTKNELLSYQQPAFFITSKTNYSNLKESNKFVFITEGKIGHVPVVVFTQGKKHEK